jgi:hypothetical protein
MKNETLKLALDALKDVGVLTDREWQAVHKNKANELRQAIAELESQEPVSTLWQHGETGRFRVTTPDSITDCDARWFKVGDLYAHPPQRTWVGLTKEDKDLIEDLCDMMIGDAAFSTIDAILKGKNT